MNTLLDDLTGLAAALQAADLNITELPEGKSVALDLRGRQVLSFNDSGYFLLKRLLAGATRREELVAAMLAEFDVSPEVAESDTQAFLDELGAMFPQALAG